MKNQSFSVVGKNEARIDFADKVNGKAMYTNDLTATHMLHGKIHTSTHAHARIVSIDTTGAWETPGVHAVITGEDFPTPVGPMLADRPPSCSSQSSLLRRTSCTCCSRFRVYCKTSCCKNCHYV